MSEDDASQKTEEPTQKKLDDSRKKGEVPLSREVNHWLILLAGTLIIGMVMGPVSFALMELLAVYIESAHAFEVASQNFSDVINQAFGQTMKITAVIFATLAIAAFIAPFAQIGPLFMVKKITPSMDKISIPKGFKRIFSKNSLMEFLKGILKLAIVTIVGFLIAAPYYSGFEHMVGLPLPALLQEIVVITMKMMTGILVVLIVVAMIDLSFQRKQHTEKMKMSKQEVKDEHKQTEGDPHVKGKLRQLRAEKGRQRMMQAVPEADVIITNPTHYAIALKYNPDETPAPICVAKGVDDLALRIREVAKEHNVEIVENKPLARAMYDVVEVDQMIPTEHFQAVAEVISYVFKLKGKI